MRHNQNLTDRTRFRRLRWLAVTAVLAAAAMAANTITAVAQTDTQEPVSAAVASYASDYGVSHSEARTRLARIDLLQELMESIRDLEAERLAGWGIDHHGRFMAWVQLTGSTQASADAGRIAAGHADLEIRTGASHTYAELLSGQRQLMGLGAIGRTDEPAGGPSPLEGLADMIAFTGIDMANNAVRVGIDSGSSSDGHSSGPVGNVGTTDDTFATAAERAGQLLAQVLTVNYTIEDGSDFGAATDFMGGQQLAGATGQQEASWCTSGFTAKQRGTGAYGVITAAHCVETYSSNIAMTSVDPGILLSSGPRRHGPDVDAMFRLIPTGQGHRALDDHLCDETVPCDVSHTVTRTRMMSAPVCHYGNSTGHTCGTVVDINFDPGASNDSCAADCNNTFVRVTGSRVKLCEGDSGGPVHYDSTAGNKAYGIVSGGNNTDDCVSTGKWFYFSPIESVEDRLRVDVLTLGSVNVS
ncbi:MAG: trypsin-like serine protease [Acidimicrobiaceae bacterium]|nr:trypsin-like serine protease [Acidimicrobiaceae bacterium]MYI36059.1 trypsin-like serine protease [Acidimicrobiaceae bacterium]